MIDLCILGLTVLASILSIVTFFRAKIQYKWAFLGLGLVLSFLTVYLVSVEMERNVEAVLAKDMRVHAQQVADCIVIGGYDQSGEYLGYLMAITNFYSVYKDRYSNEFKNYSAELASWQKELREERKKDGRVSIDTVADLRGLVRAGRNELEHIASSQSH